MRGGISVCPSIKITDGRSVGGLLSSDTSRQGHMHGLEAPTLPNTAEVMDKARLEGRTVHSVPQRARIRAKYGAPRFRSEVRTGKRQKRCHGPQLAPDMIKRSKSRTVEPLRAAKLNMWTMTDKKWRATMKQ